MIYPLLKFAHLVGIMLIGAGLIGVWLADLRARQLRELVPFAEAVRNIALFYDGLVVPGALLLLASGSWLISAFYGGWAFVEIPWLSAMVALFLFEFVEGNTVTRLYFMRLRRLTNDAMRRGRFTPELMRARGELVPSFTHFLDLPILLLIVALGALRPETWALPVAGLACAVLAAAVMAHVMRKRYPPVAAEATGRSSLE